MAIPYDVLRCLLIFKTISHERYKLFRKTLRNVWRCPTYVGRRINSWNQFGAFDVYYVIIIKTQKKEKKVLSYRKSCQGQTWLDNFFLQNITLKDFSFFIVQEHKQACFVFYSWIFHEWNWNYSNPISKKCFDDLSWANI